MSNPAHDLSGIHYTGRKDHSASRILILQSKWNPEVTGSMAAAARETLEKAGVPAHNILFREVPGSYELPSAADLALRKQALAAVICIGCVIQGETRHFEFISAAVAQGCIDVSVKHGKPVIFGVLTPDTMQQALDRAGGRLGNKGQEAAVAALEMIDLNYSL